MERFTTEAEALRTYCEEHNVKGCATCNKVEGECDFGSCLAQATHSVVFDNMAGDVGEIRPCCAKHVPFMRQGAPFGVSVRG